MEGKIPKPRKLTAFQYFLLAWPAPAKEMTEYWKDVHLLRRAKVFRHMMRNLLYFYK